MDSRSFLGPLSETWHSCQTRVSEGVIIKREISHPNNQQMLLNDIVLSSGQAKSQFAFKITSAV